MKTYGSLTHVTSFKNDAVIYMADRLERARTQWSKF